MERKSFLSAKKTTLSGHLSPSKHTLGIQKILFPHLFLIRSASKGFVLTNQEELLVVEAIYMETAIMENVQVKYATKKTLERVSDLS